MVVIIHENASSVGNALEDNFSFTNISRGIDGSAVRIANADVAGNRQRSGIIARSSSFKVRYTAVVIDRFLPG